ncbi:U2 small nuclear ribonucleoprotein A'-like [Zophobas morio]|uniref:U2 small nuclear ribonucleoprotein A'-like n=1 Tax=Zophobas morio TaxID=2755281 RepID=UPI00308372FD
MRITAELIEESPQFLNTLRDRELDLRGNKVSAIENLGATLDQFDTIDLSDNEITRLEGFPQLKKLKTLFLNNNKIQKVDASLHERLPGLAELILTNNNLQTFTDIEDISKISSLRRLSLLKNPVAYKPNYRAYVIYKIPHVTVLDFRKVRHQERLDAKKLFGGEAGEKRKKEMPNQSSTAQRSVKKPTHERPFAEQISKIKAAILKAKTLNEVRHLEALLQAGKLPEDVLKLSQDGTE